MKQSGESIRVVHPLFQVEGGGSIPTSPLQLHIGKIDRQRFARLNEEWHSRLPNVTNCYEGICFGAEFDGKFYAVAWWSKPIAQNRFKDGHKMYELRRFAIAEDAPRNTASRMLSVMVRMLKATLPNVNRLISYQDTEVHSGTIYKAAGWKSQGEKKFTSWKNRKDFNRVDQSESPKIRWELDW